MAKLYVQAVPPPDLNKNTEWFMYPGVWTTYIFILFVSWLLVLSVFGCTPGMAWTIVNLGHFAVPRLPSLSPPISYSIRIIRIRDCLPACPWAPPPRGSEGQELGPRDCCICLRVAFPSYQLLCSVTRISTIGLLIQLDP
jgi:hypothetical protein